MANSFTNVFTGNPVAPTFNSYNSFALTGNITLNWATQFIDTPNIVYQWMDFSVNAGGYDVIFPDATQASVGQFMIIRNTSGAAHSFTVQNNIGGNLATLAVGQISLFVLTDNSTIQGTWGIVPFGGGFAAVSSVAASALTAGITIGGSPITSAGTLTFSLADALVSLAGLGTTGILVQSVLGTIKSATIVGGLNIDVANGDGILGNPTVNLSDTITGLSSLDVGNFNFTSNTISTVPVNQSINIIPNGTGSILLGPGLTPPTISSTGNLSNVVNLTVTTSASIAKIGLATTNIVSTDVSGNLTIAASSTGSLKLKGTSNTNVLTIDQNNNIFHPSIPKCWVAFDGTTGNIINSYNVTSVARTGAGQYTITIPGTLFTTQLIPLPDCFVNSGNALSTNVKPTSLTTLTYNVKDTANAFADPTTAFLAIAGL